MTELFDSTNAIPIEITHRKLMAHLSGFAVKGKTIEDTEGLLIFIPTRVPDSLFDIIKR